MAIKALAWMVRVFEPPVYCYHEIVHNRLIVEEFRRQGVVFVDDVDEVPPSAPVMLSAHGSAPEVEQAAASRGRVVIDACCPLVTKVHHELKVRAHKGYTILYVGHAGHEEAIGTMAVAPGAVHLVEHEDDVDRLDLGADAHVALLAQTTLAHDEWEGVVERARERYRDLWMPGRSDLCYATTNRQDAVKAVAPRCDAMVVLGSANSSNTVALAKVAAAAGCPRVLRVNAPTSCPKTSPELSASLPERRLPTGWSRISSPAWPPGEASRSCPRPRRTSTSLPRRSCVTSSVAWRSRRASLSALVGRVPLSPRRIARSVPPTCSPRPLPDA